MHSGRALQHFTNYDILMEHEKGWHAPEFAAALAGPSAEQVEAVRERWSELGIVCYPLLLCVRAKAESQSEKKLEHETRRSCMLCSFMPERHEVYHCTVHTLPYTLTCCSANRFFA